MGSEFSGGGTLEAGLVYQMLDKDFGVEYKENIAAVYRDNHGDHIYAGEEDGEHFHNILHFSLAIHPRICYNTANTGFHLNSE